MQLWEILSLFVFPFIGQYSEDRSLSLDSMSYDPDSIWRRRQHRVINIGEIDHLGRYRSRFEQPPENPATKTVGFKMTQAMKR